MVVPFVIIVNKNHVTGQEHRFQGPVGAPFMVLTHENGIPFYNWTYGQRRMVSTEVVKEGPPNGTQTIEFYSFGEPEPTHSLTRSFWFDHFGRRWVQVEGFPPRPRDTRFGYRAMIHDFVEQAINEAEDNLHVAYINDAHGNPIPVHYF